MPGVVSLLEGDGAALVRSLWREVEERCGLAPQPPGARPHITYHVAGSYEREPLLAAIEAVARELRPFEVECSALGIFTGEPLVLHMAVTRSAALARLQARVVAAVEPLAGEPGPHWQEHRWMPHVTLAMEGLTAEAAGTLVAAWANRPITVPLRIANLAVMDDSDGSHRLLAQCAMGGGQAGDLA